MQALERHIPQMELLSDRGTGRAFVVVFDEPSYQPLAEAVAVAISERNRALVLRSPSIDSESWQHLSDELAGLVRDAGVRQASFLCFGAGAALAQNLALAEPKVVRTLIIVDASARPHPTTFEVLVDRVEAKLPMGLPLRLGARGFNVRSYLHRLRCPLLVVTTARASSFVRAESDVVANEAPTAWRVEITETEGASEAEQLSKRVVDFQDTPVKCPQKNVQR